MMQETYTFLSPRTVPTGDDSRNHAPRPAARGCRGARDLIPDLRIIERDFEKPEHGNQQEVL